MVEGKETIVVIGQDILFNLPDEEREKFIHWERYKRMYEREYYNDEEGDVEWEGDAVFKDIGDLMEFCGEDDLAVLGNDVSTRKYDVFTEEDKKYFEDLAEKEEGNQLKIRYEDEGWYKANIHNPKNFMGRPDNYKG